MKITTVINVYSQCVYENRASVVLRFWPVLLIFLSQNCADCSF